jgi:hypothetical protein
VTCCARLPNSTRRTSSISPCDCTSTSHPNHRKEEFAKRHGHKTSALLGYEQLASPKKHRFCLAKRCKLRRTVPSGCCRSAVTRHCRGDNSRRLGCRAFLSQALETLGGPRPQPACRSYPPSPTCPCTLTPAPHECAACEPLGGFGARDRGCKRGGDHRWMDCRLLTRSPAP